MVSARRRTSAMVMEIDKRNGLFMTAVMVVIANMFCTMRVAMTGDRRLERILNLNVITIDLLQSIVIK